MMDAEMTARMSRLPLLLLACALLPACRKPAPPPPAPSPAGIGAQPAPADLTRPSPGATRTPSGLVYEVLRPGAGDRPTGADRVLLHYSGWTHDGKSFDSTAARGQPVVLPVRGMIPGWAEAIQDMRPGERRRVWVPEALAYAGQRGQPAGDLVYDLELIAVMKGVAPPAAPPDLRVPPPDAERTRSGLVYKVLRPGAQAPAPPPRRAGRRHQAPVPAAPGRPGAHDRVEVRYTGWTADGRVFDATPGEDPATVALDNLVPGLAEGIRGMAPGERRRLWVPAALAYAGQPGRPRGDLVFDVELVRVVKE